jgi:2-polyprenyl-3-methyl-5-hydroxy-6-metoxy-1,4-benzoquinol methylase
MAFLQVTSTNPSFSYLIKKNPASGLVAKELRKGVMFGYYSLASQGQTYNIYFRDAFNDISYPEYKDQEFEYVNATRYSSAQFILNALSDLLRDAFKKRDTELDPDTEFETTIFLNMVLLENKRTLNPFTKHFSDSCTFKVEDVCPKYYRISITTKKSLYYLLNLVNLFAVFIVIRNKAEYIHVDDATIEKYFSSLSVIDPPYFIRYHFKTELLRGFKIFEKYKPMLETSSRYPITMKYGDTVAMRMNEVEKALSFSNHIVDIGCGEGRYVWAFAKKLLKGKTYHAIDTDKDCRDIVARKVRLKEITNVRVFESVEDYFEQIKPEEPTDFILGEVIEHMSLEDAEKLIIRCLSHPCLNSLIVTTPNADFNCHYFDDKDVRHPDHQFELTKAFFEDWIRKIKNHFMTVTILPHFLTSNDLDVMFVDVGDAVNEMPVTLGAIFTRRKK